MATFTNGENLQRDYILKTPVFSGLGGSWTETLFTPTPGTRTVVLLEDLQMRLDANSAGAAVLSVYINKGLQPVGASQGGSGPVADSKFTYANVAVGSGGSVTYDELVYYPALGKTEGYDKPITLYDDDRIILEMVHTNTNISYVAEFVFAIKEFGTFN